VDADIDNCKQIALTDDQGGLDCWNDLDKKLMEDVGAMGSVPVAEHHHHHQLGRDELGLRPVLGCDRLVQGRGRRLGTGLEGHRVGARSEVAPPGGGATSHRPPVGETAE
jgi:hypothetical protein